MNPSHVAPRANPGGALPRRNSASLESHGGIASRIGAHLRKLMAITACFLAVTNGFCAPSVRLAWDANSEPDIAGYELSYGDASGIYPSTINVGNSTTVDVTALTEGKTYYFVVAAYNSGGLKSLPSSQISYTVPPTEDTNTAPSALAQAVGTAEDTPLSISLNGTDAEGSALSYAVVTGPVNGTLTGTAPNLTYTPAANFNGSDSFTFRVNDGSLDSATATVSISVTPVNDAPVAQGKSVTTPEDTPIAITLGGFDIEGSSLAFSIVNGPANGTLTGTAPNLIYSPSADFSGNDSFTYRVNDGAANSANATVSITVTAVNDAPVANSKSVTTSEDTPLAIVLSGSDKEFNTLTFSVVTGPSNGTLSGTPPNLSYSPAKNFNGSDSFTFRVNDGTVNSAAATVSIAVTAVNDTPVAVAKSVTTTEDTAVAVILAGTDVEGGPLTYSVVSSPTKGTLSGIAPNLTYTPTANATGSDSFTFRVNDGSLNSPAATVSISISAVNDAPVAIAKSISTAEDTPVAVVLAGTDVEGSPLTYEIVTGPAKGALGGTAPNLTYTPAANINGGDSFTYRVNDGTAKSATATVSITITPVNDAPVASAESATTQEDTALPVLLSGTDPDGDALTYSIVASPTHGTLSGTPPDLTYLPNSKFSGTDQFTFRVNDGTLDSSAATIAITVTAGLDGSKNTAPTFKKNLNIPAATEDVPYSAQLTANDPDAGDVLTFSKVSGPAWILVSPDGAIGGTPSNSDVGTGSLAISVSDSFNATATATLSIKVSNTNDAPVFHINPIILPAGLEKTRYSGQTLVGTASDPDAGDRLSYSMVSGPEWLTVAKNGSLSGTPPAGSAGINQFTVRATDAAGDSGNAVLEIEINSNALPLPWKQQTVGEENLLGEASFSSGTFTLTGSGALTSTEDSANFSYQTVTGDGQITARVVTIDSTGNATNAGIMIRESLAPDSRQAFLGVSGRGDIRWIRRAVTGKRVAKKSKSTRAAKKSGKPDESWIRLVRKGDTITAFKSSNGKNWDKVGRSLLKLPKNCYIGLSVSSGNDNKLTTSKFSNVRVIQ